MANENLIYERYFKDLLENPDGTINMEALKNELHDLFLLSVEYAEVYHFISDGFLANGVRNYMGDEIEDFLRDQGA